MKKETLLLKLFHTVGDIRNDPQFKGEKSHGKYHHREKEKDSSPPDEEKTKKRREKLSPLAQSTLCLLRDEGSMNQRAIAKANQVTGQAVSDLMKKLEGKELISRKQGNINNETIISLTEKGEAKADEVKLRLLALAEKYFTNFSEEEMSTLFLLLEKMEHSQEEH